VNYDRTRHYGIDPRILAVREGVRALGSRVRNREDQDLFLDMARAWTNIALVEGDVSKLAPEELSKRPGYLELSQINNAACED
jgi:hypothetical protein